MLTNNNKSLINFNKYLYHTFKHLIVNGRKHFKFEEKSKISELAEYNFPVIVVLRSLSSSQRLFACWDTLILVSIKFDKQS